MKIVFADVQLLRLIAVSIVIAEHLDVEVFKNGFIGVDIFFVISGYLVFRWIHRSPGGFYSIKNFLMRRVVRLLPSLYSVVVITFVVGFFLLPVEPYENLAQSVISTVLLSNNVLLYLTSNYFDVASKFKPLLHTWSLGVEEQFYIFSALFFLMFQRFKFEVKLASVFIISIVLFIVFYFDKRLVFYISIFRFWEFAAGGMAYYFGSLPLVDNIKSIRSISRLFELCRWLILVIIIYFATSATSIDAWPNIIIFFVVVLTAIFLIFRTADGVEWFSSQRIFLLGGNLSYSLYLVHFPVVSFALALFPNNESYYYKLLLLLLIVVFSYFLYTYVEVRFRNYIPRSRVFKSISIVSIFLIGLSSVVVIKGGIPERFPEFYPLEQNASFYRDYNLRAEKFREKNFLSDVGGVKILIIGDSFARDFYNILDSYGAVKSNQVSFWLLRNKCIASSFSNNQNFENSVHAADIVFVSFRNPNLDCISADERFFSSRSHAKIVYVGTKDFGVTYTPIFLNLISDPNMFLSRDERITDLNASVRSLLISSDFIDIYSSLVSSGFITLVNNQGYLISNDHIHLTPAGAAHLAPRLGLDKYFYN